MASVKFLEEALSTDVDESAVSAIVGSLETQLVNVAAANQQQNQNQNQNQNHNHNHRLHVDPFHNSIANGDSLLVDPDPIDNDRTPNIGHSTNAAATVVTPSNVTVVTSASHANAGPLQVNGKCTSFDFVLLLNSNWLRFIADR